MLDLYENIRRLRIKKEMSQGELAKRVGYTGKSMIARIEKGEVDLAYSKILAFADALGVRPAVLMGWAKEESTPLDVKTEKHIKTFLSLSPERREKVTVYAGEQLEMQTIKEKKCESCDVKEA